MGTLLYARGIIINRCYDELNVTHPDVIREIHTDYLRAGAEIVETNTFGANAFRLERHRCADRVREFNLAGARLAREAATAFGAYVAGSVGPLGIRIEPLGKTSFEEARSAFREQIAALVEGGVDLLILETFGYLEELHQAILAAREVSPKIPVVAQIAVDDEGDCLDGAAPENAARKLEEWGADVVGCNCAGPVALLMTLERMARNTSRPLSAQPNAGMPRNVEGRNIYLCSPEYLANSARSFLAAGARLVGGCCGTTPEQIRAMKAELSSRTAQGNEVEVAGPAPELSACAPPLAERSRLGKKLAAGEFVTLIEIAPPRGIGVQQELEGARLLQTVGVDAASIPDSVRASARIGSQALASIIQQQTGLETALYYPCRGRTVHGIESDLLGAAALGLRNLICLTGEPPRLGSYPDATAVSDVDSIGLVNIVANLNRGLDIGGNPMGTATAFVIGVAVNPGAPSLDEEIRRLEYKVEAGAEFCLTYPIFDVKLLASFQRRTEHCRIPLIVNLWPLTGVRNAEFMRDEMRVAMPDCVLERMARADGPEAAQAEGIALARELLTELKGMVSGVQIGAPHRRYASAIDVLEAIGGARGPAA
jgi:homocysteine S-methyltransferase